MNPGSLTEETGFNLPVQIWVDKGGADLWIAKDVHLQPGAVTNIEGADKMVLAAGDIVKADARRITADGDAFSIVLISFFFQLYYFRCTLHLNLLQCYLVSKSIF